MISRRELLAGLGVATVAALGGIWLRQSGGVKSPPGAELALREARFTGLDGQITGLAQWSDRILICNFWATWCAPCREEIPLLMQLRSDLHRKGVEVVGIAFDQAEKVAAFANEMQISYPVLLADAGGIGLLRKLGNPSGGLPFTLVIDQRGAIAGQVLGLITAQKILDLVDPLIKKI